MTDRELLELAAKAHGFIDDQTTDDDGDQVGLHRNGQGIYYVVHKFGWHNWTPLIDDGDALRLAVKLNLIIGPFATYVSVAETYDKPKFGAQGREFVCWHHETKGDQSAATRLAIVRAAAEIGNSAS